MATPRNPDYWTLDRLIGKYSQITKLAAGCHDVPTAKNLREQAVLHHLLELKELREKTVVSNPS